MNVNTNKLSTIAIAVSLVLASGGTWAAGNAITFEGDSLNNGTGNFANITATYSGSGASTVSINQVGNGSGGSAAEQNQVGTSATTLTINPGNAQTVTAHIGQGAFFTHGGAWAKSGAVKNNIVKGTLTNGEVEVSQNTSGNTVNFAGTGITGTGLVTINQGYANAAGGGGAGVTANITQTGSGAVTINQGNSATSTVTSGTATVVHAGTHTVSITQDSAINANMGLVKTNTTGDGGTLAITQSNSGNTYVDAVGDGTGTAATITGSATLNNSGTGTVGLKQATGTVEVFDSGTGTLTVDNGGTSNSVYVNSTGATGDTTAVAINGTLSLNQATGSSNDTIGVTGLAGGILVVNQTASSDHSAILLSGTSLTGNAIINQNGDYQNATLTSANGSTGTFDLNEKGASGSVTTVNLTF